MPENEDLYEILQVHPSAHPDVIQAAYRRLAFLYHPDRNPSPEAADMMKRLNRAYETLSDPDRRAAYDQNRPARSSAPASRPVEYPNQVEPSETQPRRRPRQRGLDYITLGSRKDDVARIQGPPNSTHLDEDTGEEGWSYNKVYVTFNRAGRVTGWSIFSHELTDANVRMVPGPNATSSPFFSVYSHKDDVVRLQGTPYRIDIEWGFEFRNERDLKGRDFKVRETWYFPGGTVEFSIPTGRVTAWDNKDGSLKVQRRWPERDTGRTGTDFFTLGSSKAEVRRVQGNPINTSKDPLGREVWDYGNSNNVEFKHSRVESWSNIGGRLKVRLVPGPNVTSSATFSLGSHKDDVARLQGTPPFSIHVVEILDQETWLFSGGSVEFTRSSGRVIYFENNDSTLRVKGIRPDVSRDEALETHRAARKKKQEESTRGCGLGCTGLLVGVLIIWVIIALLNS